MNKIRLLMLLHNSVGKGTYWRALGFGRELARCGYNVTLMAAVPRQRKAFTEHRVAGVNVVETPDLLRGSGYDLGGMLRRIGWLRKRSFDLVHAFETRPANIGPVLYLQRRDGVPVVQDWCDWFGRGGSVEERPNPLLRTLLRPIETFFEEAFRPAADGITVINSVLGQKAVALGVDEERILILPNGANVSEIYPQERSEVRQRLGLAPAAPLIAYTGAIFPRDARLMAAAFDLIHAARPEARLLLVGYCNIAVEALVNAPQAVIRTGPITYRQLADYVAACDLGWLPLCNSGANRGRFPMKLNDFMAAGRAVVVTNVADLAKVVQEKGLGWVTADNPQALAQTVLDSLADEATRLKIEQKSRQVAETDFAWPVVSARLHHFYQRVLP